MTDEIKDNEAFETKISEEIVEESLTLEDNESSVDFDDEMEGQKWGRTKMLVLGLALVLILAAFAGLFYRFYPLPSKISGQWEASTVNGNYLIKNNGKKTTFVMENLNGVVGMNMSFESQLVTEGENEYFVKDTAVFLELYHEYIDSEAIKNIVGDGTNFEEVSDSKKILKLKYTKAGVAASFGDEDLNALFKYVLRDFDWKLQGKTLKLRNASFANGGVSFTKSEK